MIPNLFKRQCVSWLLRIPLIRQPLIYSSDEFWVRYQFEVGPTDDAFDHLRDLVEKWETNLQVADETETAILLGDALHWLGHFEESRGCAAEAQEFFRRSLDFYNRFPEARSRRINGLNGREHAANHLARSAS